MILFEIIKAFILGIVEGITEWLPISSTGHMILVDEFIKLNVDESFKNMFFVIIQLGAIMAVVLLYFHKLNPFSPKKSIKEKKETVDLWLKVIVGCIPAAVIGFLFDDFIEQKFNNYLVVAITLIVYGILFIVVENYNKGKNPKINSLNSLTYKTAAAIGCFQVLSLIPGTSRSGATILGGILIGCSRFVAAEYTFFLAIPIMFGASLLKLVKYVMKFGFAFGGNESIIMITGLAVSFFVSIFAIKFLMTYIKKNNFKVFGYYRIILGILVILYFALNSFF